jgi:hypothetical protein
MDEELIEDFWWFTGERHQIYRRRFEQGDAPPWTTDHVLATYRFTNVYRDLDPGTVYILDKLDRHFGDPVDLFWTAAVYRMLNRIETFERRGFPDRLRAGIADWHGEIMEDKRAGTPVATGAHCTHVSNIKPWLLDWADDSIVQPVIAKILEARSALDVQRALNRMRGLGAFMSQQVMLDYLWSSHSHLSRDAWVPLAVGSNAALDLMLTGSLDAKAGPIARSDLYAQLHATQRAPDGGRDLTYTDLEHALCEWGKYRRISAGRPMPNRQYFKTRTTT